MGNGLMSVIDRIASLPLVRFIEGKKKFKSPENNQNYRINFRHIFCYGLLSFMILETQGPRATPPSGVKTSFAPGIHPRRIVVVIDWSISETQC